MKFTLLTLAVAATAAATATTTITAHPGCPTAAAADVMVTRSAVAVPSCEAGSNSTKPSIVSMPGYGATKPSGTATGSTPEFTGAAARMGVEAAVVVLGSLAVWVL